MFIKGMVTDCDFTGRTYPKAVEGAHGLARGATGRVCAVMHAGPEYVAEHNIELTPRSEAEAWAASVRGGSIDF